MLEKDEIEVEVLKESKEFRIKQTVIEVVPAKKLIDVYTQINATLENAKKNKEEDEKTIKTLSGRMKEIDKNIALAKTWDLEQKKKDERAGNKAPTMTG